MLRRVGYGAIFLSLLLSLWCGVWRVRAELADREVELIADYESVAVWASTTGVSTVDFLRRLKGEGLTACSLPELSLLDLGQRGLANLKRNPEGVFVRLAPEVEVEALASLEAALGGRIPAPSAGARLPSPIPQLLTLPLVLDPFALRAIREAGLRPVPRPTNHPLVSARYIERRLEAYRRAGANLLVFSGEAVWGYPRAIPEVAGLLKSKGFSVALTEFSKQAGAEALAARMLPHVVRLHSITERELGNYTPEGMAARFARAVKERRVRAVYIRLPSPSGAGSPEEAIRVVSETARLIRAAGCEPGRPLMPNFPDFVGAKVGPLSAALGGCGAFSLAMEKGFEGLHPLSALLGVALFLLLSLAALVGGPLGAKLCALLAALSFPLLGMVLARGASVRGGPLCSPLKALLVASGVSTCGGLLVASSLTSPLFLLKIDQFAGVKLSLLLPVVAVGLWRLGAGNEMRPHFPGWWGGISESARKPLLYGHVVALILLLGLAAFWMLRTGNVPGVSPPSIELRLREAFEKFLYARPRFKEFAFSHPLLMVAALLEREKKSPGVAALLWAAGAIGQVSILNSFSHLHTPLLVALLRTANGVWLGAAIGTLICWALGRAAK